LIAAGLTVVLLFSVFLAEQRELFRAVDVMSPSGARRGHTLVLDAGHGGADGGAVSVTGTQESVINLAIVLKMDQIAGLLGIDAVLTRDAEQIAYPGWADTIRSKKVADQRARVQLINARESAFLISVHQNKYASSGPFGAQTFYNQAQESRLFAETLQEKLILALDDGNKRPAARIPDDIYLMKNVACPAVLVECGFLSNPREAALLETDVYQLKLAALMVGTWAANMQL